MQVEVLDDDHLHSLQCSKCHKYLSVFPVKNHVTRDVTCGRCSGIDDEEGVRSTLYELIAEKHLFKCVNRYEGCRKLLRVEETEAHEKVCVGKLFHCPKCRDGTDLSALELIWHYKVQHPLSYLKRSYFEGKVPVNDVMLYVQDDVVFFILFEYDSNSNIFYFGAATLTEVNCTQVFTVSQGSFCKLTENKTCRSINNFGIGDFNIALNSTEFIKVIFMLQVSKNARLYNVSMCCTSSKNSTVSVSYNKQPTAQFKPGLKKYSEYKWSGNGTALVNGAGQEINLACSNCKLIIGLPVFRCTKSRHQLCYSCRTWCGICKCSVVKSLSNDELIQISSHLNLSCKWKCGKFFSTSDIRDHEGVCELRVKECPRCFTGVDLKLMKSHLLDKHKVYFLEEYDVDEVMDLIYSSNKNQVGNVFFILNEKWCEFEWNSLTNHKYKLLFESFESLDTSLRSKLGVTPSNSKFEPNTYFTVELHEISSYKPYFTFVGK